MTEEKIVLRSLLTFLCVAHQGFALLSLFSSLPNENLVSTKLVFLSQSPTIALAWQMDLFSPASSFSPCPSSLCPTLSSSSNVTPASWQIQPLIPTVVVEQWWLSLLQIIHVNYSSGMKWSESFSRVWLFTTSWTVVHGILQARILEWGAFPFARGIFPTQGSNPGLPHCRWILYQLNHKGSPGILEWIAYPFSRGSSWPRNRTGVSCIAGGFFTNWAIREAQGWIGGHETNLRIETTGSKFGWWVKNESRDINTVERSPFSDKNPEHICSERSWASFVR